MSERILLVDDDVETAHYMAEMLTARGHVVDVVESGERCLEVVRRNDYEVVITDHYMSGITGAELCSVLAQRHPDILPLLLTAYSTTDIAALAVQGGAYDFLVKPVSVEDLTIALDRALAHQRSRRQVTRLRSTHELHGPIDGLVGSSQAMADLSSLIRRAAPADATVLITGESGTGKELVARSLHTLSPRAAEPFLAINCAAMTESLLESELFGHEAGAFTDATSRVGLFVQARRGTVFLDEIGEMPLSMQVKLLRVLQERRIRRIGSDTEIPVEARIVAATNRDLTTEVEEGRLREDLFHRLNVLPIEVPSLSERRGDILELAEHVLAMIAARTGRAVYPVARDVMQRLLGYRWPGNVRELENCLERAVAVAGARPLVVDDLPPKVRDYQLATVKNDVTASMTTLDAFTRGYVRRVLEDVNGNKAKAARKLGITRRSLYRRI